MLHGMTHLHLFGVSSAFHFGLPYHNSGLVAFTEELVTTWLLRKPCDLFLEITLIKTTATPNFSFN